MTIITTSVTSAEKFENSPPMIEVKDHSGRVLGCYTLSKIDLAEVERQLHDTTRPSYTTEEVLAKRRAL